MERQEKKFNQAEAVLLIILAALNDLMNLFAIFIVLVPIIGQVTGATMVAANVAIMDPLFIWVFTKKMGFAGGGLLQTVGSFFASFGVPTRTLTVASGIYIANNPKLARVAEIAAAVETGGVGKIAAGAMKGGGGLGTVAQGKAAEEAATGAPAAAGTGGVGAKVGAGVPETAFGMPEEVMEAQKKELFEKVGEGETSEKKEAAGVPEELRPEREMAPPEEKKKEKNKEEEKKERAGEVGGYYEEEKKIRAALEKTGVEEAVEKESKPGEVDASGNRVDLRENSGGSAPGGR